MYIYIWYIYISYLPLHNPLHALKMLLLGNLPLAGENRHSPGAERADASGEPGG